MAASLKLSFQSMGMKSMLYVVVASAGAVPLGLAAQLYHQDTPGASAAKSCALTRS
ncbi:hypothetical protein D3C71_2248110 [compost metagenome]